MDKVKITKNKNILTIEYNGAEDKYNLVKDVNDLKKIRDEIENQNISHD